MSSIQMLFRIGQIQAGSFENEFCYVLGNEVQKLESELEKGNGFLEERKIFLRKSSLKKKSLTLAAAMLSALEVGSMMGNVGLPITNVAEAATALTEEERIERGYPKIPNVTYYSDGTVNWGGRVGPLLSYDEDTIVIQAAYKYFGISSSGASCAASSVGGVSGYSHSSGASGTISGDGACANNFKSYGVVINVSYSNGGSGEDKHSSSGRVLLPAPGMGASPQDTRKHMKKAGIDVEGETIKINKPMDTKDINADGKIKTTGDIEAGGNVHVHGNEIVDGGLTVKGSETVNGNSTVHGNQTVDGDSRIHGSSEIDKDQTVHGNQHINGNQEVDKDQTIHGNQTVDGDSRIHGNQVIDKDAAVYGNTDLKGDLRVEGNSRLLDDVQIGDDKNKDKFDVWAKTHLHGDTTVGDDANDKFVVNATSEFKADATFDKNFRIKGELETDGKATFHDDVTMDKDLRVKGNLETDGKATFHDDVTMDKNLYVKGDSETDGNSTVHGNSTVDGDFEVKGNTKLGDDKTKDTVDINAKANLHGDTTIGDDENDKLEVNATSSFNGNATFGKDVRISGNLETDGDSRTHGNTITDGNSLVYGNAGVAQNLYVGGDTKIDGDVYGRSFNVGDERYIDKDGINANNHKIRNVADGDIGPDSLDAVNGRQLYHTREALQHNINQVGAGSAAMANLHPLEFEHNDKVSVSAAVGNYKDQTAFAAGVYVRPDTKSLISFSGTLGYGENMLGMGFSKKFGKHTDFENMTDEQLKDALAKLSEDAKDIREQNKALREETKTLKAENGQLAEELAQNSAKDAALKDSNESLRNEVSELSNKNSLLESSLSEVKNAYNALMTKVDSLMAKIGFSDTAEK